MAHAGEELGLVLARLGELAALLLDLVEQPDVLDGDHRLVGEGRSERNLLISKRSHHCAEQEQDTDWDTFAEQRHSYSGSIVASPLRFAECVFRIGQKIDNLDR